jgi:polyphosphate kinase
MALEAAVRGPKQPIKAPACPPEGSDRLANRELSWLDFNQRVLELAADPEVPLLERVKFLAIFSSNLDEFFMVRVAGLMGQETSGASLISADGRTPAETLSCIRDRVMEMSRAEVKLWKAEIQPQLVESGILIGSVADCTPEELGLLEATFLTDLYPVLTPLAVGPGQPFPYISGLSLSLGLFVRDPASGEERFARVKVPEGLNRFVSVGARNLLVPLEDAIGHFAGYLFPGVDVVERSVFRVTRDADLEVSDEAADLLEAVEHQLRRRRFGDLVRLEVSDTMSEAMLEKLREGLGVSGDQIYPTEEPLDLADLMEIANINRPDLRYEPWLPVTQSRLQSAASSDVFSQLRRGDLLIHLPYDSFVTSVETFVRAAAKDPGVIALKTTVYRTSFDSPVVPALIEAAEAGKQSVCLVELKARFDERHNIEWSRALEQAGVHVVYGFPNLKIHAKITLVVRREGSVLRRYVHIGTGNYHSLTARLYEDFGLFTSNDEIAADVSELFNILTGFGRPGKFRKILVAPFNLRSSLKEEIRRVAKAAEEGERALIRMKLNAFTDPELIEALYQASQAGAKTEILCRGVCGLRPGVPGMSENIHVRSVLGRFLEHSRVYAFEAGSHRPVYMGSADLMPRNLDERIEVVVPVEDPKLQQELINTLDLGWADNGFAWELVDDHWHRVHRRKGDRDRGSQNLLMRRAKARNAKSKPKAVRLTASPADQPIQRGAGR